MVVQLTQIQIRKIGCSIRNAGEFEDKIWQLRDKRIYCLDVEQRAANRQ
jgi:hypothetical protein